MIEYFDNLYLRGDKIKVRKEEVFTHFIGKGECLAIFLVAKSPYLTLISVKLTGWPFFLSWPISVTEWPCWFITQVLYGLFMFNWGERV